MAVSEPNAEVPAIPPVRRVPQATMLAYGFGAVAYGVKDLCFSTFLLLFYNQVLGLPSAQVGFAIMCALLLDAVIDPAIGFLSDRTGGLWGRRHPWMYASAAPIALGWLLLWNPPAWSHGAMLVWVFASAVLVRTAVSAYEVPSQALSPELSADYDERTRIMAYRYLFGWAGGMAMLMASYGYFLADGLLERRGYVGFAAAGAAAMFVAILVSALGTHREISRLPRVDIARQSLGENFHELRESVRNRAFLILMGAGICYYSAQGISYALSNYLYAHVWGFRGADFQWLGLILLLGVIGAFLIAPRIAKRTGKPVAAMGFMIAAAILLTLPYWLRLAGLFPAPGNPLLVPLLLSIFTVNATCVVSSTILGASMMADVVEHSEDETGRRSEGVFFAGAFFVQKCTSGLGIFVAGSILAIAGFPEAARPGSVPVATVDRLTILFATLYVALGFAAAFFYWRFPFGKAEHLARVERLAKAEMSAGR
ncbi:MFS transporter [Sphingomonas psychrotolerans]|uniref:MFS transporter n=1 Tax=Sphingomonas psychrotolerans TaxID=1327635 RepID=A0ABU3N300_9SPHN|nr:MFS transporter [Sphingomonas psychrotolerans]MDT8758929.1 MFS transporter [Sphingomonas psychrotolerans]